MYLIHVLWYACTTKKMYCRDICVLRHVSCIFRPTSKIKSMYMQTCFFACCILLLIVLKCLEQEIQLVSQNMSEQQERPFHIPSLVFSVGRCSWKTVDFLTVVEKNRCFLVSPKSNLSESSNLSKISGKDAQCPLLPLFQSLIPGFFPVPPITIHETGIFTYI